jgi:hypothetical protein
VKVVGLKGFEVIAAEFHEIYQGGGHYMLATPSNLLLFFGRKGAW